MICNYREEHPEWFALVEGKRQNTAREPKLCHANPEMVEQAIADVLEGLRRRATTTRYGPITAISTARRTTSFIRSARPTKEFSVVGKGDGGEELILTVWGPHDA